MTHDTGPLRETAIDLPAGEEQQGVSRRDVVLGTLSGLGIMALVTGCAPRETTKAVPATAAPANPGETTSTLTPSPETKRPTNEMPIPGYGEMANEYRENLKLPLNEFYKLPLEEQVATIYATMLHGIGPESVNDGRDIWNDPALAITMHVSRGAQIKGGDGTKKDLSSFLPHEAVVEEGCNPGIIVLQHIALRDAAIAAAILEEEGQYPDNIGGIAEKMLSAAYTLDNKGNPVGGVNGQYKSTVANIKKVDDPDLEVHIEDSTLAPLIVDVLEDPVYTTGFGPDGKERRFVTIISASTKLNNKGEAAGYERAEETYMLVPFKGPGGQKRTIALLFSQKVIK